MQQVSAAGMVNPPPLSKVAREPAAAAAVCSPWQVARAGDSTLKVGGLLTAGSPIRISHREECLQ